MHHHCSAKKRHVRIIDNIFSTFCHWPIAKSGIGRGATKLRQCSPILFIGLICFTSNVVLGSSPALQKIIDDVTDFQIERALEGAAPAKSILSRTLSKMIHDYAPDYRYITAAVSKALTAASTQLMLPNPDDYEGCESDYAALCPQHWLPVGDGTSCTATGSYAGACGPIEDFTDFTPLQKFAFEKRCNTRWPCIGSCIEDFNAPCPVGYAVQSDGSCVAEPTYHGRCIRTVDFRKHRLHHRKLWGEACSVRWPCTKPCLPDPSAKCPTDWYLSRDGRTCVAPLYYVGPCSPVQPTTFSRDDFLNKCHVSFQCMSKHKKTSSHTQNGATCTQDYENNPCPIGWLREVHQQMDYCVANEHYKGPCAWRFPFPAYNRDMKIAAAAACEVSWPCEEAPVQKAVYTTHHTTPQTNTKETEIEQQRLERLNISGPYNQKKRIFVKGDLTLSEAEQSNNAALTTTKTNAMQNNLVRQHLQYLKQFEAAARPFISFPMREALNEAEQWLTSEGRDIVVDFRFAEKSKKATFPQLFPRRSSQPEAEKESFQSKHNVVYADLKESGWLPKRSVLERVRSALLEKPSSLKSLGFPKAAYTDVERLTLTDDIQAATESYSGKVDDAACARDYTHQCPLYWTPEGEVMCLSDVTYGETLQCPGMQPFGRMNAHEKEAAEKACGIRWPCKQCGHDFIRSYCPQGWHDQGNGICRKAEWLIASRRQRGPERCPSVVNFKYMSPQLRKIWAEQCEEVWPCFQECERDFSPECPKGWMPLASSENKVSSNDGVIYCQPKSPNTKTEACGDRLRVPSDIQKRYNLEAACGVRWPCRKLCKMNFWQHCPYGFTYSTLSQTCVAPDKESIQIPYKGPCPREMSLKGGVKESWDKHYKKLYAERCNNPWPCEDYCDQDYTDPCPWGWEVSKRNQDVLCSPPPAYKGPCLASTYNLTSFETPAKWEFAWKCQVRWRCGGKTVSFSLLLQNKKWMTAEKRG